MRMLATALSALVLFATTAFADQLSVSPPQGPSMTIAGADLGGANDAICNDRDDAKALIEVWKKNNFEASLLLFKSLAREDKCFVMPNGTAFVGIVTKTTDYGIMKDEVNDADFNVQLIDLTGPEPPYGTLYVAHRKLVETNKSDNSI